MTPTVRHDVAPPALGCRWCGVGEREHAQLWVPSHGWHGWTEPTRKQVEARMRARLAREHQTKIAARETDHAQ